MTSADLCGDRERWLVARYGGGWQEFRASVATGLICCAQSIHFRATQDMALGLAALEHEMRASPTSNGAARELLALDDLFAHARETLLGVAAYAARVLRDTDGMWPLAARATKRGRALEHIEAECRRLHAAVIARETR